MQGNAVLRVASREKHVDPAIVVHVACRQISDRNAHINCFRKVQRTVTIIQELIETVGTAPLFTVENDIEFSIAVKIADREADRYATGWFIAASRIVSRFPGRQRYNNATTILGKEVFAPITVQVRMKVFRSRFHKMGVSAGVKADHLSRRAG